MSLLLTIALLQAGPGCDAKATAAVNQMRQLVWQMDLPSAVRMLASPAQGGCAEAGAALVYLSALQAARDAYPAGGSEAALTSVRRAIATFETQAAAGDTLADIARVVLLAACAAAQSERDDMATLLEHATSLEKRRVMANIGTLPVSAHEVAGDLWLQVHRFEEARNAYRAAADVLGATPRIAMGLARAAVRLKEPKAACSSYNDVLVLLSSGAATSRELQEARPEAQEARRFLEEHECVR